MKKKPQLPCSGDCVAWKFFSNLPWHAVLHPDLARIPPRFQCHPLFPILSPRSLLRTHSVYAHTRAYKWNTKTIPKKPAEKFCLLSFLCRKRNAHITAGRACKRDWAVIFPSPHPCSIVNTLRQTHTEQWSLPRECTGSCHAILEFSAAQGRPNSTQFGF